MASSWKFAVLSDINYADGLDVAANTLEFLVRDIKNQGVDLVIFPGDMIAGSKNMTIDKEQLDSWKAMMKPLYDAEIPIYIIRGNHEADSIMGAFSSLWLNEFPVMKDLASPDGGFTYSFTHKNARFVGFDQYINNSEPMMNSWVTTQINDSTSPLNFAFAHVPLFPVSYAHNSVKSSWADDPKSRDALISALGTHHGTYFAGHEHVYLRVNVSDGQGHKVPELIVGTAGRSNYNYSSEVVSNYTKPENYTVDKVYGDSTNPYFGYLLVTVYDNNTWTGKFKGYQDTYDMWNTQFPVIQTLDRFSIPQEQASRGRLDKTDIFGIIKKYLGI
ncbi:MAG: metallophosphoesterase [Methanotrichaceae archaeon]|nr:metallophosphoesterase [Methanotrichaceae archaeon]